MEERKDPNNKTTCGKGDISTRTNEIQRIISMYFENLYSCELETLDEMDKFLDPYNQQKLSPRKY
jgi:hypothetical protein